MEEVIHGEYASSMTDSIQFEVLAGPAAGGQNAADVDGRVALLQAVADPIRWTVLHLLARSPACVCNLQEHVPIAGNLLSYHLKVLRDAGLVTSSRRGRWIDYALADDALDRLRSALPGADVTGADVTGPVETGPVETGSVRAGSGVSGEATS